jgi:serine/threonine protein kinase/tetratricopeptide (TPR) repeat protein
MTIRCPKCNTENPDSVKFCGECGAKLGPARDISITKTLKIPKLPKITKAPPSSEKITGKYKILEELGRGGMGVVVKAKDTRLERTVALKFLPPELTRNEEAKKRFIQEAKAAAALDHPNICTVYEVDEADDQTYIAMSYIEGQSLNDKLKEGPMDVDEAKDIAIQVAEGLKEAHEKGIVHRDIKPANIMLTEKGQTKITDFGLAKLSWGADLTKPATIMGTVAYMSPEQARGEEVDHRTDIWSLGAMLYEMLTGKRPFKKKHEQALIYSILNEEPQSLSKLRPDIPSYIEEIIFKTLKKEPEKRYQNIQQFIQDMKRSLSPTFSESRKSIVVLPFENLSPDPEQEYFCDGMTEEIISDLSTIRTLRVISRNTAMMFKGTRKATTTIGRELNVQYVLEGSVRKVGHNLRITAQLIDAASDSHLWAKKYSGTLDDVFDIQEKVSRSIVDSLKLELSPDEENRIAERPINDMVAYECYLRAKQKLTGYTEDAIESAIVLLKRALSIEGPNELLYATLGQAYTRYWSPLPLKLDELVLKHAEAYADKVFELNPDSPEGHTLKGTILAIKGMPQEAVRHVKKAYQMNPNNSLALWCLVLICGVTGQIEAARFYYEKLSAIEAWSGINPGWIEFYSGNILGSIEGYRKEYEMDPESPYTRWAYGFCLAWTGQIDKACDILSKIVKDTPDNIFGQFASFLMNALRGRPDEALRVVTPELIAIAKTQWQMPWMMAAIYSQMGRRDESLEWLEHAVTHGFINYPFLAEKEPFLQNVRNEPRFQKLMERVKHEWENFEV